MKTNVYTFNSQGHGLPNSFDYGLLQWFLNCILTTTTLPKMRLTYVWFKILSSIIKLMAIQHMCAVYTRERGTGCIYISIQILLNVIICNNKTFYFSNFQHFSHIFNINGIALWYQCGSATNTFNSEFFIIIDNF